ncbi:3-oxoacyl-[acyl-carrier protein] reductase [Dongia mobilis]|uniref:3-oxoacyl-[acyl-carrier protein] reductase n=1 Tax=Dongia mobilis TaxID=578943 RepID=A0A4R6WIF7_9PROT|nr:glucose 1-dehydrogenase [Dongia mobilis]TDQ77668.1 3-oxoacyl-[acyl-carrier protein] reductase [Dongia mobilis]
MKDIAGRTVLITGGATGIGAAISRAFADAGAKVAVHFHSGGPAAAALLQEIQASGGQAVGIGSDLTKRGNPEHLVAQCVSALGGLDILVNNAGGMVARRELAEIDDAFIDQVFDLNVRSTIHCCQAALPHLARAKGGVIVNVSSVSARTGGSPGSSIYSGTKGFIATFTRSLARELAPKDIRVNAVSPGTIATDFHVRHSTPEKLEATRKSIPQARLGAARDCAGTVLYLASNDLAGYITGQIIEVNGGQLMA